MKPDIQTDAKPYRLLKDTTYHRAGDIVHLLLHQVMAHHEPITTRADVDDLARLRAQETAHVAAEKQRVQAEAEAKAKAEEKRRADEVKALEEKKHADEAASSRLEAFKAADIQGARDRPSEGEDHPAGPEAAPQDHPHQEG